MKRITYGYPEEHIPSKYCKGFNYQETDIKYDTSKISFKETARGCVLELPLKYGEEVFGFGLQLKEFNHKNTKKTIRVNSNTVDTNAPVPFFVTTENYGIYFDTARYAEFNCGFNHIKHRSPVANNAIIETEENTIMSVEIPVSKGIDIYIIEGKNITDVVAKYNMLSGGGCDVPQWGLGVLYRVFGKSTEDDIKKTADYFIENDILIDIIGLEASWQSNAYACSYVFDPARFPNYKETVKYLTDKDFHINLWEHAYVSSCSPIYKPLKQLCGDYEVWKGLIPDFSFEEARDIFAIHHKNELIELGIDGFKLDECDNSDSTHSLSFPNCTQFPSGMDGELYHSLFGTLYMQTILKALGNTPTLSEVSSAGALASSYPFVLCSDLYDHKEFIRGIVNSGFSGLLWSSEVRNAKSKKDFIRRLQTAVFSVQCSINGCLCEKYPWIDYNCEDEVKELLEIRKTLAPMLKKAFEKYKKTGIPPVRALVMDYTNDKETYKIDDQYIFCDNLIVAPLTENSDERKVYLPKGKFRDYWTKEPVSSGWFTVTTENIPVYEKYWYDWNYTLLYRKRK